MSQVREISAKTVDMALIKPRKPPGTKCEECDSPTREGKPYCPEHVFKLPYVQSVVAKLEKQKEDDEKALAGKPDLESLTAQEIETVVANKGGVTIERLAGDINAPVQLTWVYVTAMVAAGVLDKTRSKRGFTMVTAIK